MLEKHEKDPENKPYSRSSKVLCKTKYKIRLTAAAKTIKS